MSYIDLKRSLLFIPGEGWHKLMIQIAERPDNTPRPLKEHEMEALRNAEIYFMNKNIREDIAPEGGGGGTGPY